MTAGAESSQRAAYYVRVSTGRQAEEGFSLDEQERRTLDYIERERWTPVGPFREEGVSGAKASRPELDKLLARLDDIDVIVVTSLDRLGRSTKNLLALYDQLERAGVRLVSLRESIDTSTPVGRLLRTVLSAVAEFERDLGRERTSAGIGGRAANSGKPWGAPAYGFRKTDDGHWEPDLVESVVLQRIFRMRAEQGMSKNGIAATLTRAGVPTRHGARAWSAAVVSRILRGREGLGEYHHGGEWFRGKHEPLITEETWRAAQALDETGRKYAPGARGRLPKRHLFVHGMLRCVCGEAMLPRSSGDNYICRAHKADSTRCPMPPLRREVVDGMALVMFEDASLDLDATRRHVEEQLTAQVTEAAALLERAEREIAELSAQADHVERDYRRRALPAESYARLRDTIAEERAAADAQRDRLAQRVAQVTAELASVDAENETLRRWAELRAAVAGRITGTATDDVGSLRAAFSAVFDRVRLRDQVYVSDALRADVDAMTRGEMPEPEGVLHGRVADYVLDFYGSWERVAVGFDVPVNNRSGSGVPE